MARSNFQRKASRKQQSRLVFHPVDAASAPAPGSSMSPARLRYAGKKQPKASPMATSLEDDDDTDGTLNSEITVSKDKKNVEKALSSPKKSSQVDKIDQELNVSDSDVVITSARRLHGSVNRAGSQQSPSLGPSARIKKSIMKSQRVGKLDDSSDSSANSEDEDEVEEKRPTRLNRAQNSEDLPRRHDKEYIDDVFEDDSDQPIHSSMTKTRVSRQTPITSSRSFIAGGTSYNAPIGSSCGKSSTSKSKPGRGYGGKRLIATPSKSSKKAEPVESSSDESDEDDLPILPTPKPTQSSGHRSKKVSSSVFSSQRQRRKNVINVDSSDEDANDAALEDSNDEVEGDDDDDDDDDDVVISSPLKRRRAPSIDDESEENEVVASPLKRRRLVPKVPKAFHNDNAEEEEAVSSPSKKRRVIVEVSEDSDDLQIVSSPVKKGKQKATSDFEEESDEDELPSPKKKQKLRRGNNSSPTKLQGRVSRKHKRTAVQKKLELLRRKRAGEDIDELTESEQEEQGHALYDSDSDLKALSNFDDESEDDKIETIKKKRPKKKQDEEEEDDFVVEDDDEELGAPEFGLHDIPLEFTHAAHKRKKEHFKDAVEWMVQRKINPAFNRRDPVFSLAFRKLDDELRGHAMSSFASSVWREGFTRALFARPEFFEEYTGVGLEEKKCDACNRSKHPATFRISFGGKAYHKDSLEDVDNDPDSDEDPETHQDVNENGERIPAENEEFNVGVVCKGNAEMAHSLTHWKYALNEWVVGELKSQGYLTPEKLAAREEMNTKKRSKIAEGIVDSWESSGEIKKLYGLLKAQLETASQGGPKKGRWGR